MTRKLLPARRRPASCSRHHRLRQVVPAHRAGADRHRHHQRRHRQSADRRPDRRTDGQRRRPGETRSTDRGHHPRRAAHGHRLLHTHRRGPDLAGEGERGRAALPATADRRPDQPGRSDAGVDDRAGEVRRGRSRECAARVRAQSEDGGAGHRDHRAVRPGADGVRQREGEGRLAEQADRRRTVGGCAGAVERRAGRDEAEPGPEQSAAAGGGQRAARQGRRPARVHRAARADRRDRGRPRGAGRRGREPGAAGRDA